jgi:polysaccharide pyruvyl transferase WcaK-like protein
MKIVLLDPSLKNKNENSDNLGDLIIRDSILLELNVIFNNPTINRISTHEPFDNNSLEKIDTADLVFVGGTNILTTRVKNFNRLKAFERSDYAPGINKKIILFGCGTNVYESRFDLRSFIYYRKILNNNFFQSFRDDYSRKKFSPLFLKSLNTSCPTTWRLNINFTNQFNPLYPTLFTLTDYSKDYSKDIQLIKIIVENTNNRIYFFPQGANDEEYLKLLIKNNNLFKDKIQILDRSYQSLIYFLNNNKINYIGTRLHAGILCYQFENPNLIIAIDNRAREISKDINLNTCDRVNLESIMDWLHNKVQIRKLAIPYDSIAKWKSQFSLFSK